MASASAAQQPSLTLTYLANEGVLLEAGDTKVVIDGLHRFYREAYAVLPDAARTDFEHAKAPFDGVDLVLVSHRHGDHFDADAVASYLTHSSTTWLASSPEVTDAVRRAAPDERVRARIRTIPWSEHTEQTETIHGIDVTFLGLHHGKRSGPIQNFGHLIELGGVRVLHVGDAQHDEADYARYALPRRGIDVALVPYWYVTSASALQVLQQDIAPRQIVAFHVDPREAVSTVAEVRAIAPTAITLTEMLSRHDFGMGGAAGED